MTGTRILELSNKIHVCLQKIYLIYAMIANANQCRWSIWFEK